LKLVDFEKSERLEPAIAYEGTAFFDDGKGNDVAAGDGVYTSPNTFQHTDEVPYDAEHTERSVASQALADPTFTHLSELQEFLESYTPAGKEGPTFGISVECDVSMCYCNTPCGGCTIPWGPPRCFPCISVKNCKIKVGLGW
jgi:hypothetical protein